MTRRSLLRSTGLFLLCLGFLVPLGCDDETGPREVAFRVDLTVLTPDDRPAAGIEVRLHVPIPDFDPTKAAARRARTVVQLAAPVPARHLLEIYDLEGRLVRRLTDAMRAAGVHAYTFDGHDDAGHALLGTQVLDFRFSAFDAEQDTLLFEDRYWATLFTGFDREQTHLLGVTNSAGRLTVTDRTAFPGLYDLPPMTSTDENGQERGSFSISQEVEFVLHDPAISGYGVNPRSVSPGLNEFVLSWIPSVTEPGEDATTATGDEVHRRLPPAEVPIDPPTEWTFHQNYPNPFN